MGVAIDKLSWTMLFHFAMIESQTQHILNHSKQPQRAGEKK